METWVEEIEDWDARSVTGGYAGLRDLADREFSGAVSTGATWLFMVNGRVVGVVEYRKTATGDEVRDADVEAFEDAEATAYAAPDPSVPLLVAMKTADGETRAKYYTEDTPVDEVHDTLSDGSFTGYLELSENVLSGDYYLVYQGGRASELAFVGNARRLLTGEEAYDRTVDEVGIYEVTAVDLAVVEIPEPTDEDEDSSVAPAAAGAGVAAGEETDDGTGDAGAAHAEAADESATRADGTATAATAEAEDPAADEQPTDPSSDAAAADADDAGETTSGAAAGGESDPATTETDAQPSTEGDADDDQVDESTEVEPGGAEPTDDRASAERPSAADANSAGSSDTGSAASGTVPPSGDAGADADATGPSAGASARDDRAGGAGHENRPSSREGTTDDRATSGTATTAGRSSSSESGGAGAGTSSATDSLVSRSIPSLDPDRTDVGDGGDRQDGATAETQQRAGQRARSAERRSNERQEPADPAPELERELEEARETLADLREERDRLREQRDDLKGRVETLQERVADLEAEVEEARTAAAEAGAATGDGPSLSVAEAFAGTNLFVRYRSKGELTLEDVHDGKGEPGDLASNLELEHHTQFEDEHASVAGQQFEEWLRGTQQYRFVQWLVGQLLFEIRDTGSADAMRDLYDALPEIDRVELDASVEVRTQEGSEERSFDLVARDRMGQPLVVANLDSSRDPVSEGAMASLVESGTQVCSTEETLSGAFFVASSFFDPDALETAREATSDSLLSRDKRKSFVKLTRKRGFHLGLVEARDGSFHLSVPDL